VKYLIDTNAWIGFLEGLDGFGTQARALMAEQPGECRISIAGLWEAAIKVGLGKLRLPYDLQADLPRLLGENGFEVLPLDIEDALGVRDLTPLHGDPFDRIQVIQARRRNLTIISRDPVFERYGLNRVW
jgi:PIN domain nuclease of toxin-antitoxin system